MKELAEMYRRQAVAQAEMYRSKAAATDYPEAVATWTHLASVCDHEAFMWECAAR